MPIPQMIKGGGGVIINTANGAGIEGVPRLGAYRAAKGRVVMMLKGIALDFVRQSIRCVSIYPGVIETPIAENCGQVPPGSSQQVWARSASMHPPGRNGKPEEVAVLVAFLASVSGALKTGMAMPIDGASTRTWIPPKVIQEFRTR